MREGTRFVARVDFYLPRLGVVLEFDGMAKYRADEEAGYRASPDPVIQERARERRVRALGYGVGRITWGELDRPDAILREIAQARTAVRPDLIATLSNGANVEIPS